MSRYVVVVETTDSRGKILASATVGPFHSNDAAHKFADAQNQPFNRNVFVESLIDPGTFGLTPRKPLTED